MTERQSNIELLRIIAMTMIVLVHANYYSLGEVTNDELLSSPFPSFIRIFFERICLVGVNIFILISGWFGLRPSLRGGGNILYQVVFYVLFILIISLALNLQIPDGFFKMRGFGGYWFIAAYMLLYILSPVLNAYIEHSHPKKFGAILICFFMFETYSLIVDDVGLRFSYGCSAIHFIGMYLLARFVRLYVIEKISKTIYFYFVLFLIFTLIPSIISFVSISYIGKDYLVVAYSSPFVVASSVSLVLFFNSFRISSKFINWIACSVFSIYLIHMNPIVVPYFVNMMKSGYEYWGSWAYILYALTVAIVGGMLCVIVDKMRIFSWRKLSVKD